MTYTVYDSTMRPTDSELEKIKDKLTEYKQKVSKNELLEREEDYLELDIEGGRIWLHPQPDGTIVHIHYFNDTGDSDETFDGTGTIMNHLTREVGFPTHGKYEPFNFYFSNERRGYKVDYEYFIDEEQG